MIFRNIGSNILIVKINREGTPNQNTFYYKNYGSENFELYSIGSEILVHVGKYIEIEGHSNSLNKDGNNYYYFSIENGKAKVQGNLIDLINRSETIEPSMFFGLFKGCNNLFDASQLILPSNVNEECYADMFADCQDLNKAPQLPATTLATRCYYNMFNNCTSLTIKPSLPASSLAEGCYDSMFEGCTSLSTAPELPAIILTKNCYSSMFNRCQSLTSIPSLPATTLAYGCYAAMFKDCKSLINIPQDLLSLSTLQDFCYSEMFYGCENLINAPILSATDLTSSCYYSMFANCKSLKNLPELPATNLAPHCYESMFQGCDSIVDLSQYELPAMKLYEYSYACMFDNCKNLTTAPYLLATDLASSCYQKMFNGCTSLTSLYIDTCICDVENGTTSTTEEYHSNVYIKDWLKNTALTGIFYGLKDCYDNIYSEIPSGWDFVDVTPLIIIAGENTKDLNIKVENTIKLELTTIQYRVEGEAKWNAIPTTGIVLETSGVVEFRNLYNDFSKSNTSFYRFNITGVGDVTLSGALQGLNNFNKEKLKSYQFTRLFEGNDNIVSVSGLDFQFKKLQNNCYSRMFADCINLENIPMLTANTLAQKCYKEMFQGCISLTGAITMKEKVLKPYCYQKMFEGCEWIASADLSQAEEISLGCFRDMFYGCTNLTDITIRFDNWKSFKSTDLWLTNTAYFGNFTKPQKLSQKDDSKIPQSWKPFINIKEEYEQKNYYNQPDFTKHKTLVKQEEIDDPDEP